MKLRKNSEGIIQAFKSVADRNIMAVNTFLSFDINGNLIIESFRKLIDYDENKIAVSAADRQIYVYGDNLKIVSFSKTDIQITGKITKIELMEVK